MANIKRCKAICKYGDGVCCNYQDVELNEEGQCSDMTPPDDIELIDKEQASSIIDTRKPLGLFYLSESGGCIAIDNSDSHAWTEEFKTEQECFRWLRGCD